MKKSYIILLGFFLFTYLNASAQAWEWAKDMRNLQSIRTVADNSGNVYIAGTFIGSCDLPGVSITAADTALFIAKYTDSCQLQWYKKLDASEIELHVMQVHNDEVYIGGWFTGQMTGEVQSVSAGLHDIFIARFSSAGNCTFFKRDGGAGSERLLTMTVYDTHILCGGEYHSTGSLGGNVITAASVNGSFFAKYTPTGDIIWVKSIHPLEMNNWGSIQYVKSGPSGNIYVIGSWEGSTDFGGVDSSFQYCQVLLKYDQDGNFLQFMLCSGDYGQWVTGLEIDEQENLYTLKGVAGNHSHPGNCLTKYTSSGSLLWSKTVGGGWSYGDEGMCNPNALTLKNGLLYMTGAYWGRVTLPDNSLLSGEGLYVMKYDTDGNLLMVRNSIGGTSYGQMAALDADNAGNVYVVASVPKATFGDHSVNNDDTGGFAFAKLNSTLQESHPMIVLDPATYSQCAGEEVYIKATVQNATSIRWYLPDGRHFYGGEAPLYHTDPSWLYDSAGVYSAYVVISNSTYRDSIAFPGIITINYPEVPALSVSNETLICTTQNDSVNHYRWYMNGQYIQETYTPEFVLAAEGDYSVRVTFMNGCIAYSDALHYTPSIIENGAVTVNTSTDLLVVPNPGSGDFQVTIPAELKSKGVEMVLFDLSGRVVERRIIECCDGAESIQAKGIAKGVYLLNVTGDGKVFRQRVVVQ